MRVITGCQRSNHNRNEPNRSGSRPRKPSSSWKPCPGDRMEILGKSMSWKRFRPEHDKMFKDKRWPAIKAFVWERDGGLCRVCKRNGIENGVEDGYIVSGFACHHVIPFESAKSQAEMERLFFDVNNIILVCKECHAKIHKEMGSHTKEKVAERKAQRRQRFMERNDPNYKEEDNGIQTEIHERPVWETNTDRTCETQAQANAKGNR